MKDAEDSADNPDLSGQGNWLRLVHSEKRERLLPDPELKTLIEKMKDKPKSARLKRDDGPEAA